MSELRPKGGELSQLSLEDLAQAYVESIQDAKATEHIGRKNRLVRRSNRVVQELRARGK